MSETIRQKINAMLQFSLTHDTRPELTEKEVAVFKALIVKEKFDAGDIDDVIFALGFAIGIGYCKEVGKDRVKEIADFIGVDF